LVLGEVHQHVRGLSTRDVVVIRVLTDVENYLYDLALAAIN
jgi:hypothetical protein